MNCGSNDSLATDSLLFCTSVMLMMREWKSSFSFLLWRWKWELSLENFSFFNFFFFLRIILFQKRWKKYKFKIFWIIMTRDWKISFELKLMVKRFVWKFYMSRIFFLYLINNIDRIYYDHMHSILRDNCFKNIKGCFY